MFEERASPKHMNLNSRGETEEGEGERGVCRERYPQSTTKTFLQKLKLLLHNQI